MKILAYSVVVVIALFSANLSAQDNAAYIKFRIVRTSMIILPVQVNDSETLEFLLDTGSASTVIVSEVAARLKLRPTDRIELVTPTGTTIAPRSFLSNMKLGGHSAENIEVLWSDLSELRRIDRRISGILGQNFLAHLNFTLDIRGQRMVFGDAAEAEMLNATRVPFESIEGRIVVTLTTGKNNLRFVLDSGVDRVLLFGSGCRKLANRITPGQEHFRVAGLAGMTITSTGLLNELRVGDENLRRLPVVLLDEVERPEDGLMPLNLFRSVYFNNREKYLRLGM